MKLPEANAEFRPHSEAWDAFLTLLPPGPELERWARTTGALCRKRGVKGAAQLLRVALCYGFCNLSLEVAASWARCSGTARLTSKAVLKRLKKCGEWLELVLQSLLNRRPPPLTTACGLKVQLVDATRIACPGSKGTTWRVHASYDPWECKFIQLKLTDNGGGERLDRFKVGPSDLLVADRGYAQRRGLAHVVQSGGHFLVRTGWKLVKLLQADKEPFDLFGKLRGLAACEVAQWDVLTEPDERNGIVAVPCRLVAYRHTDEQAAEARKRLRTLARKDRHQLDERTLEASGYLLILTSVPNAQLSAEGVLDMYRTRWQIELKFKRMKSILELDRLPAKDAGLVRSTLAAKLIGAVLVEEYVAAVAKGATFRRKQWALTTLAADVAKRAIVGPLVLEQWFTQALIEHLDSSSDGRKRQPQTCVAAGIHF
jgi:hypothetical protein